MEGADRDKKEREGGRRRAEEIRRPAEAGGGRGRPAEAKAGRSTHTGREAGGGGGGWCELAWSSRGA